jgi:outer membrane protein assembly factor BamA
VPKGEYEASVRFEAYPDVRARIGDIDVIGADRVSDAVVRRMLTFEPGDIYTRTALIESQRNLFAQDVFRHAEIQDFPVEGDTLVDVRVQVNEGDLHRVRTGLGLSSAEYLNAEVRWVSRNFFGGARRLELRGAITNLLAGSLEGLPVFEPTDAFYGRLAGSASADFTQPWFFGPRNSFGSGVFLERQSFPDVFVRTAGGGYVSLSRSLQNGSFSAGYRPELTKLATAGGDLIFCIGFTACGPDEVEALSQANWLAPLSLSYARDMSNSLFAPTRGYTLRFDAELATAMTGSDFSYYRLSADLIDYHTFRPGWVWALRISPGYARAINDGRADLGVHPQKRFFAGGPNTVRGFAQYRLGPKVLTIDAVDRLVLPADSGGAGCTAQSVNEGACDGRALAGMRPGDFEPRPIGGSIALVGNAEIRFPITPASLQGAVFMDYGQVWETQQAVRGSDIVWTPGLGVRYFSPIGPIRIDVGYYAGRGETRSVVTTTVCPVDAEDDDCTLDPGVTYERSMLRNTDVLQALERQVLWNPRRSFFDRLQFHFSIVQAF